MRVLFDNSQPDAQLHLVDRKLISARLARLVAIEATRSDYRNDAPPPVKEFIENTDTAIRQVLRRHEAQQHEPPVDDTLTDVHEQIVRMNGHDGNEFVEAGLKALRHELDSVSCSACSAYADRTCRGLFNDYRLFEDAEDRLGGLCVGFIRSLTDYLLKTAEELFDELSADAQLRPPPDHLKICMESLGPDHDGTMPLEGSYDPVAGHLMIQMPTDPDNVLVLDEAILMLPYLVFHEVFVHGGQGRALDEPIGDVLPQCAFTEGAVDAAARYLLIYRILGDSLPVQFAKLQTSVHDRCKAYGLERSRMPEESAETGVRRSHNVFIRKARSVGTLKVWDTLRQVEEHGDRARDWALSIITRLNFALTTEQRDQFMMSVDFWQVTDSGFRDELLTIFDRYLENGQVANLLDQLDDLGMQ